MSVKNFDGGGDSPSPFPLAKQVHWPSQEIDLVEKKTFGGLGGGDGGGSHPWPWNSDSVLLALGDLAGRELKVWHGHETPVVESGSVHIRVDNQARIVGFWVDPELPDI